MKFVVAFKTPDALDQIEAGLKTKEVRNLVERFVEYGEYIRIEFDTEAKTATVLEVK